MNKDFYDGLNGYLSGKKTPSWVEGDSLRRFKEAEVRQANRRLASGPREPFVWETHNTVFAVIGLLAALYVFGVHLHQSLKYTLFLSFMTALLAGRFAKPVAYLATFYAVMAIYAAFHGR